MTVMVLKTMWVRRCPSQLHHVLAGELWGRPLLQLRVSSFHLHKNAMKISDSAAFPASTEATEELDHCVTCQKIISQTNELPLILSKRHNHGLPFSGQKEVEYWKFPEIPSYKHINVNT